MGLKEEIKVNIDSLKSNSYPGRGIVIGETPNGENLVQVYWIMGRSASSRNRIFKQDGEFVKTQLFKDDKTIDTSLIVYYPARNFGKYHIITNGDQTDTIYDFIKNNKTFEEALNTRTFEPDGPNFTPRISGIIDTENKSYKLSILKSIDNNEEYLTRQYFNYEKFIPGVGHLIHTYKQDGNPLESFKGEPKVVNIYDDIDETINYYWDNINSDNRVSILAKYINVKTGEVTIKIINKNK